MDTTIKQFVTVCAIIGVFIGVLWMYDILNKITPLIFGITAVSIIAIILIGTISMRAQIKPNHTDQFLFMIEDVIRKELKERYPNSETIIVGKQKTGHFPGLQVSTILEFTRPHDMKGKLFLGITDENGKLLEREIISPSPDNMPDDLFIYFYGVTGDPDPEYQPHKNHRPIPPKDEKKEKQGGVSPWIGDLEETQEELQQR